MLGPFEVRAPGSLIGEHRDELTTLVAMAAVLPAGVPAPVIGELLPQPGAATTVAARLRDWLGVDPSGTPRLAERDGAWHLSPDVRVDWQVFRELVSTPGWAGEERRLASALALIRGELFAGVSMPPVAQRVLRPALAGLRAVVVQAVRRDVELSRSGDDPARAEWAFRQGMMLLPQEEALWQIALG